MVSLSACLLEPGTVSEPEEDPGSSVRVGGGIGTLELIALSSAIVSSGDGVEGTDSLRKASERYQRKSNWESRWWLGRLTFHTI